MDKTQREGRVYLGAFYEVEAKIYLRALLTLYNTIILSYVFIPFDFACTRTKKQKKFKR